MLEELGRQLAASIPLTEEQVREAVEGLIDESITAQTKADFLIRLAQKGETAEEIASFTRALRAKSVPVELAEEIRAHEILDVVGTGGDHLTTFNISTAVALVATAAGVLVAKHGNRASTSLTGSADVMEALGIPHDLEPEAARHSLRTHGFAFFFAARYHPAFRHITPARKLCAERGHSTIFNFLGPLLNPARPSAMLVGVSRPELSEPFARVLQSLGVRRAMVVSGAVPGDGGTVRYLDEISPLGPTTVAEFYQERGMSCSKLQPEPFPLQLATLEDLRGGDREMNAAIIRRILRGQERGPKRDAVLLNAAAALFIGGKACSMGEGWELAAETIDSGRAYRKLGQLIAG